MRLTYPQLLRHVKPNAETWDYAQFDQFAYEARVLSVGETLDCLNAWSLGKETVREYATRLGLDGLPPKVRAMAEEFHDGPVYVVAFTLGTYFGDVNAGATRDRLVLWDAHHRTSALAVRESRGHRDTHPVIVFVGGPA